MEGIFIPQKLANSTNTAVVLPESKLLNIYTSFEKLVMNVRKIVKLYKLLNDCKVKFQTVSWKEKKEKQR